MRTTTVVKGGASGVHDASVPYRGVFRSGFVAAIYYRFLVSKMNAGNRG